MKPLARALALLCVLPALRAQEPLTGRWQGETPAGASIVLDLKAADATFTGTLTRNDQSTTITNGKIAKNTFTFKATLGDQTEAFSGEFSGDDMKVWLDRQGPERPAVLKRVPENQK